MTPPLPSRHRHSRNSGSLRPSPVRPEALEGEQGNVPPSVKGGDLYERGITPEILIRKPKGSPLYDGIYAKDGIPTCIGQVPMQYVRSDADKGHMYRCRGCYLADSRAGAIPHCKDEVWEDPSRDCRLFGVLRQGSKKWKALYNKRQAIERTFKSLKQSRRLERHCIRGLRQITLHYLMSVLTYQATALVNIEAGA